MRVWCSDAGAIHFALASNERRRTLDQIGAYGFHSEAVAKESVDLRASYYASSRYFSGLLFAYVAAAMLQAYLARGSVEWTTLNTVLRVGILVVLLPLVWVRQPWYHWIAAVFMLVVLSLRMMTQTLQ